MFPTIREVLAARACNLSTPSDNLIVETDPEPEAALFTPDGILINPATEASLKTYFGVENEDDDERLNSPCNNDCLEHDIVENVADVRLYFNMYYMTPVRHAFSTSPHVFVRGRPPPPTFTGYDDETSTFRIDVGFEMTRAGDTSPQWALIGKMAHPGTIKPDDFRSIPSGEGEDEIGRELANGRKLCQEMRAYAWHYECPQAFAFDGKYLLILDFMAITREGLKDCKYNAWLIEIQASQYDAQPRMALYRSLRRGVYRLIDARMRAPEGSNTMR